jgi:hypothetical protein
MCTRNRLRVEVVRDWPPQPAVRHRDWSSLGGGGGNPGAAPSPRLSVVSACRTASPLPPARCPRSHPGRPAIRAPGPCRQPGLEVLSATRTGSLVPCSTHVRWSRCVAPPAGSGSRRLDQFCTVNDPSAGGGGLGVVLAAEGQAPKLVQSGWARCSTRRFAFQADCALISSIPLASCLCLTGLTVLCIIMLADTGCATLAF